MKDIGGNNYNCVANSINYGFGSCSYDYIYGYKNGNGESRVE
jgi:hypothetical protein